MTLAKLAIWIIASLGLGVALTASAVRLCSWNSSAKTHPSDGALAESFKHREADFEKLIEMSKADSRVIRIAPNFTWLDTNASWPRPASEIGFSTERWDEYRQVFWALKLRGGLLRPLDADITYLIASSQGMVNSGSAKGYAYSTKPLSPLSDSLDNIPSELRNQSTVYKKLTDKWYLFYQAN